MTKKNGKNERKRKKREKYDRLCFDSRHYTYSLFLRIRKKNKGLKRREE